MRNYLFVLSLLMTAATLTAQSKVNPVITTTGGIYDIPEATVLPDPELSYNMVVDVFSGSQHPDSIAIGLYLVSRMVNLFSVGGISDDQVDYVLAIHGGATYSIMDNEAYREKYGTDNPNITLLKELKEKGVRLTVCGQSLIGRGVPYDGVIPEVEIATSMLTTVVMYQMRGYGLIRF